MFVENIALFVGLLALAISVSALVRKSNDGILLLLSLAVAVWGAHYFLMGSVVGGVQHLVAAGGIFLADRMSGQPMKHKVSAALAFVAINLAAGVMWWTGPWDAYAIAAAPILTFSQFCLSGMRMRLGFMIGEVVMFFYAAELGSFPGMAVSVINVLAGLIGLIRMAFDRKTRKSPLESS